MVTKVYLVFLAVAAVVIGAISFYANSWLGSVGDPTIASTSYISHSSIAWTFLWVSFLGLAGISLFTVWQYKSKWAVWTSFAYFALSIMLLLYNDSSYKGFLADNSLETPYTLLNPFFVAVILLVLVVALVAAQILTLRIRVKVKRDSEEEEDESADPKE